MTEWIVREILFVISMTLKANIARNLSSLDISIHVQLSTCQNYTNQHLSLLASENFEILFYMLDRCQCSAGWGGVQSNFHVKTTFGWVVLELTLSWGSDKNFASAFYFFIVSSWIGVWEESNKYEHLVAWIPEKCS